MKKTIFCIFTLLLVGCGDKDISVELDDGKYLIEEKASEEISKQISELVLMKEKEKRIAKQKEIQNFINNNKKLFFKEKCQNIYNKELEDFKYNFRYSHLDNRKIKKTYSKFLIDIKESFLEYANTDNGFWVDIFDNQEGIQSLINENCDFSLLNEDKLNISRVVKIKNDHFIFYIDNVINHTSHVSNIHSINGVTKKTFKFGNIERIFYAVKIKQKGEYPIIADFNSNKQAEAFIMESTALYSAYMRREQSINYVKGKDINE
jgi:hypothetical protein